jgi:aspartate kinase
VPSARKLDRISTEEMLEMAASGRQDPAPALRRVRARYNMPVHVRSSFSQKEGTWIVPVTEGEEPVEQAIIAGVAHDRSEAKITVVGVPDKVGEAARIFEALASVEVNLDMVVRTSPPPPPASPTSRSRCPVPTATAMSALAKIQDEVGYEKLLYDDQIGKVSLIGAGMRSHPGITAKFFSALAAAGREHRDDLHLRDPDLGDRRRGPGGRRGPRDPHRLRPRRRRGRGRRLRRTGR